MELARIARTLTLPLTSQAIADLALKADQDRRAALKRGDVTEAAELDAEVEALTRLLP